MKSNACRWLALGLVCLPLAAAAQESLQSGIATNKVMITAVPELMDSGRNEIQEKAWSLVSGRQFTEAIPYLTELAYRLAGAKPQNERRVLEWAVFHLGLGLLEKEAYGESAAVMFDYITRFPQGSFIQGAYLILGDALISQESWAEVETFMKTLLTKYSLRIEDEMEARRMLGEALVKQEKWAEAIPQLEAVFRRGSDMDARSQAGVRIAICLIRLERFADLYRFLPVLLRTPARFDIEFNLALIEAGDRNFLNNNFLNALSLYRLVNTKAELEDYVNEQIERLTKRRQDMLKHGGVNPQVLSLIRRLLNIFTQELEDLSDFPDYDQEVGIRLARAYLEQKRLWESYLLFRNVYDRFPKHELADQCLYAAFATCAELGLEERALDEGYEYLSAFRGGDYWDEITLMMAQLHIKREEYAKALALMKEALDVSPDHVYREYLLYLSGYALFHTEKFDEALDLFEALRLQYPDSQVLESCDYWHAMTQLFKREYGKAKLEFSEFLLKYMGGPYFEDASFRLGVSQYGLEEFEEAKETFLRFIDNFSRSELVAEAWIMLGDIEASWGELDKALDDFAKVRRHTDAMIPINYAAFRSGKIFELEQRWDEMIAYFKDYMASFGQKGNFTEAIYWIGFAQQQKGNTEEALATYRDGVIEYGDNPANAGIDMILRDLVEQLQHHVDSRQREDFLNDLIQRVQRAREQKRVTLELRLLALVIQLQSPGALRDKLLETVLNERNITNAAPFTLLLMAQEAERRSNGPLARKASERILEAFRRSDFALDALKALAEREYADKRYDEARKLLQEIVERFPTLPDAGEAQKRLGDAYRAEGRMPEALEAYNTVLSVKEWRGELWPEALYEIGMTHLQQGAAREAFAYFQRCYVLYEAYTVWAARAYLKAAECLTKLNLRGDAVKTYQEMLADPARAATPEGATAREALAQLGGGTP